MSTRRALGRPKEQPPTEPTPEPEAPPIAAPGGAERVRMLEAELEALREAIRMERSVAEHGGSMRGLCALVRTSRQGGALVAVSDSSGAGAGEDLLLTRIVAAIRQVDYDQHKATQEEFGRVGLTGARMVTSAMLVRLRATQPEEVVLAVEACFNEVLAELTTGTE